MTRITGQNVVATFPDLDKANEAALALSRAGIDANRISLLGPEQEAAVTDPDTRVRDMEATGEVAKKAATAGVAGTAIGALAGAAAFVIPGVGPVVGSGIWAGLLAGGAAGGAIGGMVGGVGALSMEEFDLKYQHVLRDGKAMVAVAVDDDASADEAREALEEENPEDIHMIDGQGRRIGEQPA